MKIVWEIPLKTLSEANCSDHWTKARKRHKQQQFFIRALFNHEEKKVGLPCTVTLSRRSPRLLDDDNLRVAFKWIRDEISECILPEKRSVYVTPSGKVRQLKGRADSDPRISWEYQQEKCKTVGIKIEIDF